MSPCEPGSLCDAFVTKLDSSGSGLLHSTYLGGTSSYWESAEGIDLDSSGNLYLVGRTDASDFPTTPGAFDRTHNGDTDVFVTKLNPSGSALVYSTCLGGTEPSREGEEGRRIAVDGRLGFTALPSSTGTGRPTGDPRRPTRG